MVTSQKTLSTKQQKMSKLLWKVKSQLGNKIRYAEIVDSDAVAVDEVAIGKPLQFKKLAKQMKKYTASLVQQGQMPLQERSLTKAQSVTLWLVKTGDVVTVETQLEATKWKFWT